MKPQTVPPSIDPLDVDHVLNRGEDKDITVLLNANHGNWSLASIDRGVKLGFLELIRKAGRLHVRAIQ